RGGLSCALLLGSLRGLALLVLTTARCLRLGGLRAAVGCSLRAGGTRLRAAGGVGVHDDRDLRGLIGVIPGPLHGGEAAGGEGRGAAVGTRLAVVAKRRGPRGGGSTGGRARLAAACCALLGLLSLRGLRLPSRSGPVTAVRRLLAAPIQLDDALGAGAHGGLLVVQLLAGHLRKLGPQGDQLVAQLLQVLVALVAQLAGVVFLQRRLALLVARDLALHLRAVGSLQGIHALLLRAQRA